ncbi:MULTISPECIES: hypothetical protein [Methylobacterium]|uniref:Uncharacterized protein n=4 Tax=Pseudomonadota TaxID=1224 RepID=A0ABQ4SYV3_9HYPH|nr:MULTISPECIES: hypothetical protein [Methylobacterium]PIU08083.1 MAG: hypothetical protein COT56_02610 [Methylobacterium sp. CG09_land_8_20_14_0_10_71_15]PIU15538.1 MAG: hypothetical protein COT28_03935 [Methylobacterium sp. CG08_land_8_20_14_0_20_71_15]GBU19451.1 hypothetical protein AwMethylo_36660 [Methylobacterium sp.]GJE07675.1 hypothetical protein AOPFMNJM_3005 [Methylobacterium jeotgali]
MARKAARVLILGGVLAGLVGGLLAWDEDARREQVETCRRVLPALLPPETEPKLLRAGSGASAETARIDYQVAGRPHAVLCRFDREGALAEIVHDGRPVSGASLHFLKRYYLDTPEAHAAKQPRERPQ